MAASLDLRHILVVIKGGGDLGSGVAHRLYQAGFPVVIAEIERPTAIRRTVAFAEAIYAGEVVIEGVAARRAMAEEVPDLLRQGIIPVIIDPTGQQVVRLRPTVLVDARLAKRNLGTTRDDAPIVIALGPGFIAGQDCHAVIETQRGHDLGRVIWQGPAAPNSGEPGEIAGEAARRVLRAPCSGTLRGVRQIGDLVQAGEIVAYIDEIPVYASIAGVLRGLLHDGLSVPAGFKIGDVDPRAQPRYCLTISDKSRAIGGGVLEAIMHILTTQGPI